MLSRDDWGAPLWLPYDSTVFTTSRPLVTWPNTCVGTRYSASVTCTVMHCCMQTRTLFTDMLADNKPTDITEDNIVW